MEYVRTHLVGAGPRHSSPALLAARVGSRARLRSPDALRLAGIPPLTLLPARLEGGAGPRRRIILVVPSPQLYCFPSAFSAHLLFVPVSGGRSAVGIFGNVSGRLVILPHGGAVVPSACPVRSSLPAGVLWPSVRCSAFSAYHTASIEQSRISYGAHACRIPP